MNTSKIALAAAIAAAAGAGYWALGSKTSLQSGDPRSNALQAAADGRAGEGLYNQACASCHGSFGVGSDHGPPLVHRIYEPNHHADMAFFNAIRDGVRAHHWRFGNMPPQPEVTEADAAKIVAYVRYLQRAQGIY